MIMGQYALKVNAVEDTYNIRRIIPYHMAPDPDHGGECNMQTAKNKRKHISKVWGRIQYADCKE
jgi:hypothetical protein